MGQSQTVQGSLGVAARDVDIGQVVQRVARRQAPRDVGAVDAVAEAEVEAGAARLESPVFGEIAGGEPAVPAPSAGEHSVMW